MTVREPSSCRPLILYAYLASLTLQSAVHITLTASVDVIDSTSKPGGIWVSTETTESGALGMPQGIYPIYLIPGYRAFGIMKVTQ